MILPEENDLQPPQFPQDRIELTLPEVPQFPQDRIEKGETSDEIKKQES